MRAYSDDGAVQFASPASTSLDELVQLRSSAQSLLRRVRKKSAAPLAGAAVSRRLGRGLDFAEVREYQPGDDVRMIDWNVTARTDRTHTKLFVEEQETPVLLVVDFRASMRFGTRGMYKSMLAARLAALLGWCSVANRDRVGGFVFTDDWHSEVRPQAGRRGLMRLFRAIAQGQMHVPSNDQGQFADSLARLRHVAQAGSTVILLSDFKGFDKQVRATLGGLLHTLDLLAVQIVDPLEMALPQAGRYSLNEVSSNERLSIDVGSRKQAREYAARFVSQRQVVDDFFKRGRNLHLLAKTSQPLLDTATRILTRSPDEALLSKETTVIKPSVKHS
ncbi:MAG: DUF58 domain-containing protein [Granulosicoccus sp.]